MPTVASLDDDTTSEAEDRLREIYTLLWSRRVAILLLTCVCAAGSGLYAFLATPIYRATAVLMPVNADRGAGVGAAALGQLGQLGGLASLAGITLESKDAATEEALAVLRSREFGERFIEDHDLLPRIFRGKWDATARAWTVPAARRPTPAKGFKYFSEKVLSVSKDRKTGLVSVIVDWRDRNEAASWANELVARINAEMRSRAVASATAYREYLERELASTQLVETRDAINRLIEAQIRQRMLATVTPEYAFRTVDRALPADVDDPLRPKRILVITVATLSGFFLGCMLVVMGMNSRGPRGVRTKGSLDGS